MPTYEYECNECAHAFEKFQSMNDERIKTCPECGGVVGRLIGTGAGIIFKGSGFYETDYRSSSYQSEAKKASSGETAAEAGAKQSSTDKKSDSSTSGSDKGTAKAGKGKSDA